MRHTLLASMTTLALASCANTPASTGDAGDTEPLTDGDVRVTAASASGEENAYTFSVELRSADTGCEGYADWWEVTDAAGATLHHRRILGHSHVNEQPFARSSSPVPVGADDEVVVRAHFNPSGYGRAALKGSVAGGFESFTLPEGFGAALESSAPQPSGCAF